MGSIRRKRSPAVLIAMLATAVPATALLAMDARGSDVPVTLSAAPPESPGLGLGGAAVLGREPEPASTAALASMQLTAFWPDPLVVLALLAGYAAAVVAKGRLDPISAPARRP